MFKKISVGIIVMISSFGFSQNSENVPAIKEGTILIDGYYGFPNLYTTVFRAAYADASKNNPNVKQLDLKITGMGPLGFRGEYVFSENLGIGVDIGTNSTKITYNESTTVYNSSTGQNDPVIYNYQFKTQKIGIMGTFNYHFVNKEQVDGYFMVGAGYGSRTFSAKTTNPNYKDEMTLSPWPLAMRIGVGMRYFFTENLGANMALGIGQGGVINAGLTFKL